MKPPHLRIRDLLEKYVSGSIFPITVQLLEESESTTQDAETGRKPINSKNSAESGRLANVITNVKDREIPDVCRKNSPFRYFLDGCRRTYHLCDLSTASGHIIPLVAGQFSAAIVKRDNDNGKITLFTHERKSIIVLLSGGGGLSQDDAKDLAAKIEDRAQKSGQRIAVHSIPVKFQSISPKVRVTKSDKDERPQDQAIAQINMAMHEKEITFLEKMTVEKIVDEQNMIIVDGPINFRLSTHQNRAFLEYAVGVSKSFDPYLTDVVEKNKHIGAHLFNLQKPGDRTSAFLLDGGSGDYYAYWYLRIQPAERMSTPFAGIIRIEKALIDATEKTDKQISSDTVDYISRYLLEERHANPYGSDFRWASHLYPIYESERIQKEKYLSDHFFYSLLK